MGWLRLVGPLKLQVSFAEYSLFYRALLQKSPIILRDMGCLRLEGSLKLQVCFAKEPHKRDYILQKKPAILRSLLIVATPYMRHGSVMCDVYFLFICIFSTDLYSDILACINICVYIYMYAYTYIHMYMYLHTHMHVTPIHTCIHI